MTEGLSSTFLLVRKAKRGDPEAMDALFRRYQETVRVAAERAVGPLLRAREEPEDLAQTAFREAIRDFDRFDYRREGAFKLWLNRIVENKARDRAEYWKAAKRAASRERPIEMPKRMGETTAIAIPAPDPSVTQYVVTEERGRLVRRAIEGLPERWRRVIECAYDESLSYRDIAARMRLPSEDAARMLLRRAEQELRRKLPRGVVPE